MSRYAEDDWFDDDNEYDPEAPCQFCGGEDCDGTGYNCSDEPMIYYNLRGWQPISGE